MPLQPDSKTQSTTPLRLVTSPQAATLATRSCAHQPYTLPYSSYVILSTGSGVHVGIGLHGNS